METLFNALHDFKQPHSNFLNFFDGVRVMGPETAAKFPVISRAIDFLQVSQGSELEETRLKCLFYIAIIFKASNRSQLDLSLLNDSLAMTEDIWTKSLESLRWLLLQGMGRGPKGQGSLQRTARLRELAGLLQEYPWRRMEDRLLNILFGGDNHDDVQDSFSDDSPSEL